MNFNNSEPDFRLLFESIPGHYLILLPDAAYTIVAVSQGYLQATMTKREEILGRGLFDVFPDNPADPEATGTTNLRASLERVIKYQVPDAMAVQKYDIPDPISKDGSFEVRYWSPINSPVFDDNKKIKYIVHQVEDVTEFVRMKMQGAEQQTKTSKMEIEIIARGQQLQKSNEELRHTKANLEQLVEARTRELKMSERKFSMIFDNAPFAVALINLETTALADVNPAFVKMFGFSKEEMIGKTSVELGMHQEPEARQRMFEEFRMTGQVLNRESKVLTKSGEKLILSNNLNPIELEGIKYILVTLVDVTERIRAESALKESETQFRNFANSMPQLAWMANRDGYVTWYNKGWYDYTGTTAEAMEGWGWQTVLDPFERERVMKIWNTAMEQKMEAELQVPLKGVDGHYKWFLTRVTPIKDFEGNIVRWFGTSTNIDEQIRTHEELAKTLRDKDEFLAIASHELKTPITTLKLQNQMAMRETSRGIEAVYSKERTDLRLHQTDKQINRLERLINDMLDMSRMRTGNLTMHKEKFDLREVINDVIERLTVQFEEAKAQLPNFISSVPIFGNWDKMRIEQVITNLLTNALRYGRGRPINIHLELGEQKVKLIIQDHGIGISKENHARIFNRFERAVDANEVSGMGVGLYISQQIIKSHNGKISVMSEPEMGSTFTVELPISD